MIDFITVGGALWALASLIGYERKGSDFHLIVSLCAVLLMWLMAYLVIWILVKGNSSCWELAVAVIAVAWLLWKVKGNVGRLIR